MKGSDRIGFDPVLLAVMSNRVESIVREMANTLLRSGRSAVLSVARDFSCSVITSDNELLAAAEGLPIHVIGSELLAEAMTAIQPDFAEGDAFLHNDPYLGNTHAADHAILIPVFWEGQHVFTACAKAHQADCGNSQPTTYMPDARDVYEEGALIFPCVRIQQDYHDVEDIIRMCRRRIRVPDQWYGDYLAALGAARIGEQRLKELCELYGLDVIREFVREWFDYSERRMTDAVRRLPSGTLVGRAVHDPYPGLPDGVPLEVALRIDSDEGYIELDLQANPDNYPGGLNLSRACAANSVIIGVLNSIDHELPHNAGAFRRIRVQLREGCIVGIPRFPYSCSMATTNIAERLINLTQAAFAEIDDGFGLAEGGVGMGINSGVVSGFDSRLGGAPYVNEIFIGGSGGPGGPLADGWPTHVLAVSDSLLYKDSIEVDEQKYPFHVFEQRLIPDSEGAGRQRGALGTSTIYGPKDLPMTVAYILDGQSNPPRGVRGGLDGAAADGWKIDSNGERVDLPNVGVIEIHPGEKLASATNGGGGYGRPFERDPELVRRDVDEGWVSRDRARDVYGVVFLDAASFEIDIDATKAYRDSGESAA